MKASLGQIRSLIKDSIDHDSLTLSSIVSEGLRYHIGHGVGVDYNIFRPGSNSFFALFREARELSKIGLYDLSEGERDLLDDSDLGTF